MVGDSIHLSAAPSSASPPVLEGSAPAPPSKELLERLAFSAGMAKVTKLGVYEEQFDAFAEGVAGIPKLLQSVRLSFPSSSPLWYSKLTLAPTGLGSTSEEDRHHQALRNLAHFPPKAQPRG
jgi:hypothetical protein